MDESKNMNPFVLFRMVNNLHIARAQIIPAKHVSTCLILSNISHLEWRAF